MIRFSLILLISAVLAASAIAQSGRIQQTPTPTPQDDTVRISTEEIKLNVLAFDDRGEFFSDVTSNDLVITENNILHQPTSVRRLAANVLIVMDTGGELRSVKSLDRTRAVARALVESLRTGDSVSVLQYSDKAEIIGEWTNEKASAISSINRARFGRRSVFIDALSLATEYLVNSRLDNKHIVLITDGTDTMGSSSERFDAVQKLLATDISVHILSYTAMETAELETRTKSISNTPPPKAMPDEIAATLPNGTRDIATAPKMKTINLDRTLINTIKARKLELELSQQQLEKLAENTNGEFIAPVSVDELIDKASLVSKMIDASYVVTYTPKISVVETRGIAERTIDVTSKRVGLVVQARRRLFIKQ